MLSIIQITTPQDWEVFKTLLLEYAGKDLADAQNSTIWNDLKNIPGRYAAPEGAAFLAHWGGEVAGCGALANTREPGTAEVKRVYVRDAFRRKGIARSMTERLIKHAQQTGYTQAAISTWDHNASALALYRQLGFNPVTPFKDHPSHNLVYLGVSLLHS